MAELSITAAQVKAASSSTTRTLTKSCGEVIDAGQSVADVSGTVYLFEADHSTTTRAVFAGIALNKTQLIGQPVTYAYEGPVIVGTSASVVLGQVYLGARTAGGVAPAGDTTNTGRINIIGVATETTSGTITVNKYDSGVNGKI